MTNIRLGANALLPATCPSEGKLLRPFGARPPARRDSSFRPALTTDIQKFVKLELCITQLPQVIFPMVLNPKECGLFQNDAKSLF